jgi:hypothetical protein
LKLLSLDFEHLFKQAFHVESSLNDCQSTIERNESDEDAIFDGIVDRGRAVGVGPSPVKLSFNPCIIFQVRLKMFIFTIK